MDTEKKPKRPRIGANLASVNRDATEGEARYEKVNYPGDGSNYNPAERAQRQNYGERYQNRQPYNNYNRQGGYNNRYANNNYNASYQPRKFNANPAEGNAELKDGEASAQTINQQEGGYQPRTNQNYQPGGYNNNRQGGYNNNRQGGYNNRQGGYNNRQNNYNQNRYNNYQQRGYNQGGNDQEGGYQPRQPRQGGYNNNRQQAGYNNNRQGGYNNNRQQNNKYGNRPQNNRQQNNRNNGYLRTQGMRFTPRPKPIDYVLEDIDPNEAIRLNKYMANAGVCSRREADEHIAAGLVKINGEVVTELGTKINRSDVIEYNGQVVTPERKCYVLLNKPKDCVTTSDDPNGRTTVLDLVKNACQERIYPVGRLDRNTTGVLLLTNDGDLASKLTHPKYVKKKIYHVWTDKDITEEHMQQIADGIELEDGEIHADAISYVTETDRNQAGIEIHSGRNRIVRRIFESLGYRVTKLDRVYFAGLTKKNLPRGRWRYLTQEEVNYLRKGSFE